VQACLAAQGTGGNSGTPSAAAALDPEAEHLHRENESLRRDIEAWKLKLTQAEAAHGKPVYHGVKQPVAAALSAPAPDEKSAPKPEKEKKEVKGEKKKKEAAGGGGSATGEGGEGPVDVGRLDLRVGHIRSAKKHPDADSLYVEEVRGELPATALKQKISQFLTK
jgi:aminoacyl tRNA synthase complex-interacting multifunctional protein 1